LFFRFPFIAAARALIGVPELSSEEVAKRAMDIASDMCVYTNKNFMVETMNAPEELAAADSIT
jgi:ATP-dependent HslUV protease subunit HslV